MRARILIPRAGLTPLTLRPDEGVRLTDYGFRHLGALLAQSDRPPVMGGSGQLSAWAEQAVLNHLTGQDNASWGNLSPVYLALCTTLPTSSSTGSTIVEAAYTTYARTSIAAAGWTAAAGTAPASTPNSGTITCPACTAGTSTIVGMAICTAASAGNVIMWMSCASTVISTVQTPPTVAAGGISASLT